MALRDTPWSSTECRPPRRLEAPTMEPVSALGLRSVLDASQVSAQVLEQVQAEDVADANNLRLLGVRFAR